MKNNQILSAALWYAKHGIEVVPVRGKRPITPNGFHDATTDKKVIEAWFSGKSSDEVGIGGKIPGWAVIVDIDGKGGEISLSNNGFDLPATLTVSSGRGNHYWYSIDGDSEVKRRIKFLPNVDILVNGYVILPPTIHPNGKKYEFEDKEYTIESINKSGIIGTCETAPAWVLDSIKFEESYSPGVDVDSVFLGIEEGSRQTTLFRYACHLRGRPKMHEVEARILLRQAAASCGWNDGSTDDIVNRVWRAYSKKEDEDDVQQIKVYTLADLAAAKLPQSKDLIKGLLPSSGYTVLSAPPKKGKSLIAAYASVCLACGIDMWGHPVEQSGVLYLDLEQEESPAFDRWSAILSGMGINYWPANLHTSFSWRVMDNGGLDDIANFLSDHTHIRLVVIDTWADFYPSEEEGGGSNAYHREQRIYRKFLPIARDYGFAFLLVHHDRKEDGKGDMIARAGGSFALNGKAKAVWSFQRQAKSDSGTLEVTGKGIPDIYEKKLYLDRENLIWKEVA